MCSMNIACNSNILNVILYCFFSIIGSVDFVLTSSQNSLLFKTRRQGYLLFYDNLSSGVDR